MIINIIMFLIFTTIVTTVGTFEIYRNIEKKYYLEAADKGFKEGNDAPNFVDDLLLNSFSSLPKVVLCTCVPFLNLIIAILKTIGINKNRRLKIIINSVKKHWLIEMNGKEKDYYQKHRSYTALQKIKFMNPVIPFNEESKDTSSIELDNTNLDKNIKDSNPYCEDVQLPKKIEEIFRGDEIINENDVDLFRIIKTDKWPNRYLELNEKIKAIKKLDLDKDKERNLIIALLNSYRQEPLIMDNEKKFIKRK